MFAILIVIHVFICASLILVILMQSAKGEGLAGAFGGTSLSGAVFGGRGAATFLSKTTSVLAIAFMLSCLALTFISPARKAARLESAVKKEMQQQLPGSMPTATPGQESAPQQGEEVPIPPAAGKQSQPGSGQGSESKPPEGK